MFTYNINQTEISHHIKETWLNEYKNDIIISLILLAFSIYFLAIGYFANTQDYQTYYIFGNEELLNGYALLVGAVIFFIIPLIRFFTFKNHADSLFNKYKTQDKLQIQLSYCNNIYNIFVGNKQIQFYNYDIKKIKFCKNTIIVKLKSKKVIIFPGWNEIASFFK